MEPMEERVKTVVSRPVTDEVFTRQPNPGGNVFASGALIAPVDDAASERPSPLPRAA
jgi:hypothetical protein